LEGIFLKVQTQAEKFFAKCGKGISASFLKTRINALKSWVVEKIRSSIFKTLAAAGHGRIEGEGSEMVYIPNTVPDASSEQLVGVGGQLASSPITENFTITDFQAPVGEIDAQVKTSMISQQSNEAITLSSNHQFTNWSSETTASSDLQTVGDATNSPPTAPTARELAGLILQCSTWVELAEAVGTNAKKLMQAASQMTQKQRSWVADLLKLHLCSHPGAISSLTWVPQKLRDLVLEQLSFTIGQISSVADSRELCWKYMSPCKFVKAMKLETGQQQWIFQTPDGDNISVCDLKLIEAIATTGVTASSGLTGER
jgi:hypothetical protein